MANRFSENLCTAVLKHIKFCGVFERRDQTHLWALIGLGQTVLVLTNEPLGFTLECSDSVPLVVLSA